MKLAILLCYFFVVVQVYCHPLNQSSNKITFTKEKHQQENSSEYFLDDLVRAQSTSLHSTTNNLGGIKSGLTCFLCKSAMDVALWKFKTPDRKYSGLFPFAVSVCEKLKIQAPEICRGMIKAMKNETQYLLSTIDVTGEMICGLIFPSTCKSMDLSWNKDKWIIPLPKPLSSSPNTNLHVGTGTLKVLQVSDIHIDLLYQPGAKVDCSDPLCCRKPASKGDTLAGKWGTPAYCDTPYWTVENFLSEASKEKYDYVIWTGDLPAHDVWSQSRERQVYLLANITTLLLKYFPNTPVYPALGNHESYPVNSFPPSYVGGYNEINWLYDALSKSWSPWLTKDALETVRKSGFYTLLVKPGLRLISLNMNYCNNENFWMLENPIDPNGELKWLVDTLTEAEKRGEKVHIIGHIPPAYGGDCLDVWRNNYFDIITRFQHTVVAQFFGHTHKDELEIMYKDSSLKHPVSVAYISPSLTTYPNLNPGYRVYDMDSNTWEVIDHHTYVLDLLEANQPNAVPKWELEYSAKQAYNLTSLSAESWSNLFQSWMNKGSEALFKKYYGYYYKGKIPAATCDENCRTSLLCSIPAGNFTQPPCA